MHPTGVLNLKDYVVASLIESYGVKLAKSPFSVKSQTGIIICLAGCPLIWKAQVQLAIVLSSIHSKYIGLTHSMRILIPLRGLLLL